MLVLWSAQDFSAFINICVSVNILIRTALYMQNTCSASISIPFSHGEREATDWCTMLEDGWWSVIYMHMELGLYFIPLITAGCMLTAEVTALWFRSSTVECVSACKSKCHISCAAMHAEVTAAFLLSLCLSSSCTHAPLQSRISTTHTLTHACATRRRGTNTLSLSLMFPTLF